MSGLQLAYATDKKKIKLDITTHLGGVNAFQAGDSISFLLSLDSDAYVVVIYENANGELIQLIPNQQYPNSFMKAGLFIPLPAAADPFSFEIQAPFGREVLWGFASDKAIPELKGRILKNGLKRLSQKIGLIRKKLLSNAQSAFGEGELVLRTRAAK